MLDKRVEFLSVYIVIRQLGSASLSRFTNALAVGRP
jgi:hypothetical protein